MYETFKPTDLLYRDYKWNAKADHDNPKVISGKEHTSLNRTEGYEMVYFIKSCAKTWGWLSLPISSAQHLEQIIRINVPHNMEKHFEIMNWIGTHYKTI
jgi:hypothetical protein